MINSTKKNSKKVFIFSDIPLYIWRPKNNLKLDVKFIPIRQNWEPTSVKISIAHPFTLGPSTFAHLEESAKAVDAALSYINFPFNGHCLVFKQKNVLFLLSLR